MLPDSDRGDSDLVSDFILIQECIHYYHFHFICCYNKPKLFDRFLINILFVLMILQTYILRFLFSKSLKSGSALKKIHEIYCSVGK